MRLSLEPSVVATPRLCHRSRGGVARLVFALTAILFFSLMEQGCPAQPQQWQLWERYAQSAIDGQGRVIDHSAQDHTTSEGQAYGMFFALVANDRTRFDLILNWTQINLAQGDLTLHLPSWIWGRNPDGSWHTIDPNPASDADLWMAYDLMEAGRLWHEPRYDKLGRMMAAHIAREETANIPGLGVTLLSAPTGFHAGNNWLLNPSYMPPSVLTYFATTMPEGPWSSIRKSLETLLGQGSPEGFAMDWVLTGEGIRPGPMPAQFANGDLAGTPTGSYDAIRVYLWLGIADRDTPGVKNLLGKVTGMSGYMAHHVTPPQKVDGSGKVVDPNAPVGFSAAVVPYLFSTGMKSQANDQLNRMGALQNSATGLYGKDGLYYDQNLALFGSGWNEQRYRFDRDGRLKVKWR